MLLIIHNFVNFYAHNYLVTIAEDTTFDVG